MASDDNSTAPEKGPLSFTSGADDKLHGTNLGRLESNTLGQTDFITAGDTKRNVKSRHAQMIAIGGSIGTGLFVGSGQVLAAGGPAFLFLAYALTSLLVYGVVTAVMEVGTYLPVSGSSPGKYANAVRASEQDQ
ncbi:proline-specific permease [Colletotrichum musicola]|uniref:Proline-specific permease n=1 Tax=Colletotrichum musicola TaxID=2175873 RepID=A0A8H6IV77_9PEZI|nr:proline-specific permease [Colletotrichum musicola]